MTPGVSILRRSISRRVQCAPKNIRLTLEILHYIEESVVNIGLIVELDFNLIEIREGILFAKIIVSHCSKNVAEEMQSSVRYSCAVIETPEVNIVAAELDYVLSTAIEGLQSSFPIRGHVQQERDIRNSLRHDFKMHETHKRESLWVGEGENSLENSEHSSMQVLSFKK